MRLLLYRFRLGCHRFRTSRRRGGAALLLRFGICLPDPLPQSFQRVGAGLRTEPVIRAEPLDNGLDDLFLNSVGASVPFPVIEHFGETANDGDVVVSVLVFETEEFA